MICSSANSYLKLKYFQSKGGVTQLTKAGINCMPPMQSKNVFKIWLILFGFLFVCIFVFFSSKYSSPLQAELYSKILIKILVLSGMLIQ